MSGLTAVSLFAGIGGFDLALERSGVTVTAAVEINPEARGVLARRFPSTTLFNDVTEVTGDQLRATGFVPGRGIITGGFPCQDLSIAGRRAGLGGARSGLFWHIMRLADELRPRWLVLENVPGLLSAVCSCPGDDTCTANGRAVQCGEWRGTGDDRQWFPNVPHGVKGGACPGGCMPTHGGAMGAVLGALGKRGYGFSYRVLDAQFFGVPQRRERVFIVGCLGNWASPVQVLLEPESSQGHPATGGWPRAGTPSEPCGSAVATLQGGGRRGYRVDAEGAAGGHLIPVPVALRGREDGAELELGEPGDPAFALRTPGGGSSHPMVAIPIQDGRDVAKDQNGLGIGSAGDAGYTLDTMGAQAVAMVPMAFNPQTGGSKARIGYGETPTALHSSQITAVQTTTDVRRLTPLECERLQGFPDGWTDGQSDSARYRELGNAVAVPVVEWISRRVVAMEAEARHITEGAA